MKKVVIIIFSAIMLVACGKKSEVTPDENTSANQCASAPVKEQEVFTRVLTNDEIINETHKCESAGLAAESLTVSEFGASVVKIQCQPIRKE